MMQCLDYLYIGSYDGAGVRDDIYMQGDPHIPRTGRSAAFVYANKTTSNR
jgi:hypothetical protein